MPVGPTMAKEFWIGDVQAGAHDGAEVELKGWIKRSPWFKQNQIRCT